MDTDKFAMPPRRAKMLKRPGPRAAGFSPPVSMPGQIDAGNFQFQTIASNSNAVTLIPGNALSP